MPDLLERIELDGYAMVPGVLSEEETEVWRDRLPSVSGAGLRGLLSQAPGVSKILDHPQLAEALDAVVGVGWRIVRSILFDKRPDTNWAVARHRDTTIAVAERVESPGFGPWSNKEGVWHVRPPDEVLRSMLTVRVHLDDSNERTGGLLVWPGSHTGQNGIGKGVRCDARAGDALVMRPMIEHASRRAIEGVHRRVMHLEIGRGDLPSGLRWTDA